MIEPMMYVALGFLGASLLALVIIPMVHARAVMLTSRRVEAALPSSIAEIQVHKDQLRAEYAMITRSLEIRLEQLRDKAANQLAELGKKNAAIHRLKSELVEKTAAVFELEAGNTALRHQLQAAEKQLALKNGAQADHLLADKLASITAELDERSVLAASQRIEIVALKTQVDTLRDRLAWANNNDSDAPHRAGLLRVS